MRPATKILQIDHMLMLIARDTRNRSIPLHACAASHQIHHVLKLITRDPGLVGKFVGKKSRHCMSKQATHVLDFSFQVDLQRAGHPTAVHALILRRCVEPCPLQRYSVCENHENRNKKGSSVSIFGSSSDTVSIEKLNRVRTQRTCSKPNLQVSCLYRAGWHAGMQS